MPARTKCRVGSSRNKQEEADVVGKRGRSGRSFIKIKHWLIFACEAAVP
jgi:hypothetical protein